MQKISYKKIDQTNHTELIQVLNNQENRKHLINHPLFDKETTIKWINEKQKVDATQGCKVRSIYLDDKLVGWCGIQKENEKYEIAIILDKKSWGIGKKVFFDMIAWAKELKHKTLLIHFLHTRNRYKFLKKLSVNSFETDIFGEKFISYELDLDLFK